MTDSFERFEKFSYVISALHRQIQKIESDEMIKYGLKGPYAQYLAAMLRFPEGITAARLCEVCSKDKAAVSRILNEMEHKGLITKKCGDNSYRAKLLLTTEGRNAAEYVRRKAMAAVELAGNDLFSPEERSSFYNSLELISNNLQKLTKKGIEDNE